MRSWSFSTVAAISWQKTASVLTILRRGTGAWGPALDQLAQIQPPCPHTFAPSAQGRKVRTARARTAVPFHFARTFWVAPHRAQTKKNKNKRRKGVAYIPRTSTSTAGTPPYPSCFFVEASALPLFLLPALGFLLPVA